MIQSRLQAFDQYLRDNLIPIDGLSQSGNPAGPDTVTIQFKLEATQEQIDWSNQAKADFDWRVREYVDDKVIASLVNSLDPKQRDVLLNRLFAAWLKQNELVLRQMLKDNPSIVLPYDQVKVSP